MCRGVSKSGSPAPRPMMSLPSALSFAARAVTASVGDGLTFCTRFERDTAKGRYLLKKGVRVYEKWPSGATEASGGAPRPRSGAAAGVRRPRGCRTAADMREYDMNFELYSDYLPAGDQP